MTFIALSSEERQKFSDYCEQEARAEDALAQCLQQNSGNLAIESMIKHRKQRAGLYALMAKELRSWTQETMG